jgi:hypothetical protein
LLNHRAATACSCLIKTVREGVAEKHNFCSIHQKIRRESNFANNRDMNPFPHGETAADLAKMFAQFFLQKLVFATKNTIFAKIRSGKSDVCGL